MKTLTLCLLTAPLLLGCSNQSESKGSESKAPEVKGQQVSAVMAKDGLDLKAVTALLKTAKNAKELEMELNRPGGVNNLDLDQDGNVDYIHVTEFGKENARGFSLTVDMGDGNVQEVAVIRTEREVNDPSQANCVMTGNEYIYGPNHHYESSFGLGDALLLSYLYRPHPVYVSPYHYGYYPPTYTPHHIVEVNRYREVVRPIAQTVQAREVPRPTMLRTNISSPNSSKISTAIKAPLSAPISSQRTFQMQNPSTRSSGSSLGVRTSSTASTPVVSSGTSPRVPVSGFGSRSSSTASTPGVSSGTSSRVPVSGFGSRSSSTYSSASPTRSSTLSSPPSSSPRSSSSSSTSRPSSPSRRK